MLEKRAYAREKFDGLRERYVISLVQEFMQSEKLSRVL